MISKELIDRIEKYAPTRELIGNRDISINLKGVSGSLLSMLIATGADKIGRGVQLVVMEDRDQASYLYNDIFNIWGDTDRVLLFPTAYKRAIHTQKQEPSGIVQRTAVLSAIASGETPLIICTYPEALAERVTQREKLTNSTLSLSRGERIGLGFVEQMLVEYGFERVDFVFEPGQYAIRGGILDVFSFSDARPYRVDFFGDDVDSIRSFGVSNQLSTDRHESIRIIPNLKNASPGEERVSLIEYIGEKGAIWFYNVQHTLGKIDDTRRKLLLELEEPSQIDIHTTSSVQLLQQTAQWQWICVGSDSRLRPAQREIDFYSQPQPAFNKNFELLIKDIATNAGGGITTYILTENRAQTERLENIFNGKVGFGTIPLTIHAGFCLPRLGLSLYTDHQIFERHDRYKIHNEIDRTESLTIQELNSLQVGDYVVHIDHGVGRFGGLVRSNENGVVKEFIKLTYRDNDVLFVNVHSLHRISKYKDKESPEPPKIHKLGSGAWQKLKATTKAKVKDIARELIALYAKRKASEGFAFSPDTYLQTELEASFIYEDTPDQLTTTEAVKADMELPQPMDRLVCGDVGFGKTEIAIRAAFKAATDGKQVAVLVPTTVLSLQHYRTFSRRLKDFPVVVENFSRVKSTKQTHEILERLKTGEIDILIGTHKLLGKNVEFKDLGLLVVDEEQKFGVAGKEKLRHLKANVDTLTLTATPIPRTLQFSLMGARDMSIINTPPPNRQPVTTEVHEFNEMIIQEAIEYEMQRGGQVFFLHNRVESIGRIRSMVERLCPAARVAVGHGQMAPTELEKIMMDFIYGEYDVFVATTIIESGIDIANANTMIINNAHMFGLSDLHQLRGRVGRTNRKAFCYLMIPSAEALTSDAHRRLRAIEEFSDLGSGFNIAMQDLDIRGAGNILGAEQSGFIADIGFETYQKIMAEAVAELREEQGLEPDAATLDCTIESDIAAHIPENYVTNTAEKIRLYRELDSITRDGDMQAFASRLSDRFGAIPEPVQELMDIVILRRLAAELNLDKITIKNHISRLTFASTGNSAFFKGQRFMSILRNVSQNERKFKLDQGNNKLTLIVRHVANHRSLIDTLKKITE